MDFYAAQLKKFFFRFSSFNYDSIVERVLSTSPFNGAL